MRREAYEQLSRALSLPVGSCPNLRMLQRLLPGVREESMISIFSQENQYRVIKTHHTHMDRIPDYCSRYLKGEDILAISSRVDFPPCMLMRRMLESMLRVPKQKITEILRNPSSLPAYTRVEVDDELMERLQVDILRCVHVDCSYSPYSDIAKQTAGLEHELLLESKLRDLSIPFWTEADLRSMGFYKTPDIRLQVPIAIRDRASERMSSGGSGGDGGASACWRTVTWIDSKATFGDDRTHATQLKDQYSTYVNRYGPGLVIYWFGFIDDLAFSDPSVMVLEDFPAAEDIARLPTITVQRPWEAQPAAGAAPEAAGAPLLEVVPALPAASLAIAAPPM